MNMQAKQINAERTAAPALSTLAWKSAAFQPSRVASYASLQKQNLRPPCTKPFEEEYKAMKRQYKLLQYTHWRGADSKTVPARSGRTMHISGSSPSTG